MGRYKFHNGRIAVAESRSRSFQHSLPPADRRKKTLRIDFCERGLLEQWYICSAGMYFRFHFTFTPLTDLTHTLSSTTLYMKLTTMPRTAAMTRPRLLS